MKTMKLKRLFACLLGLWLLLCCSACSGDDTGTHAGTSPESTADTAVQTEQTGKPYTVATFPKDAEVVYYSDFGAVGDGVTDDSKAIRTAHAIANARNLPVRADEGKTYYIPASDQPAVIQTDTDWTGASFIIDDREIDYEGHSAQNVPVFSVEPSLARIDLTVGALAKGDTNIGTAPGVPCLVYLRCDSIKHYIRYGANADAGQSQTEVLIVDAEGNINPITPLTWDYPSVDRAFGIPTEEVPITIRGGEFLTLANEINPDHYISVARNITITRSNVTVEGVKHRIEQEKDYRAAYGGFFNITYCNNVQLSDCEIMCHRDSY